MKTQAKHSPGPWVVRTDREFYKDGAQPYCIATAEFEEGAWLDPDNKERWVCRLFDSWDGQAKADAALIASAPELLEALKELRKAVNFAPDIRVGEFSNLVGDAIAKAEGKGGNQ